MQLIHAPQTRPSKDAPMPTPKSSEALIRRTVTACRDAGLDVFSVEVSPDGTVKCFDRRDARTVASPIPTVEVDECNALFGTITQN
jgi:hypothetical protein